MADKEQHGTQLLDALPFNTYEQLHVSVSCRVFRTEVVHLLGAKTNPRRPRRLHRVLSEETSEDGQTTWSGSKK